MFRRLLWLARTLLAIGVATSTLPTSASAQCLEQKLLAPEGQPGDYFGFSVALDRTTAVVGAPYGGRGPNFASFGVVLVYELRPGGWVLVQTIEPTDGDPGMAFGHSVGASASDLSAARAILSDLLSALGGK